MTLTVHHLQVSQSERIPWLCEELRVPYKLVLHKRSPIFAPPEIKALTPIGSAPVIEDTGAPYSEDRPLVMGESGAICEYIVHRYGGGKLVLPPSHPDYADYLYWFHLSNGALQPNLVATVTLGRVAPAGDETHPAMKRMHQRRNDILAQMDAHLGGRGGRPWLAGDEFTAADIMTVFCLTTMRRFFPFSLAGYDHVLAWLRRCADRPAFKKAREQCDPEWPPAIEAEAPPLFEAIQTYLKPA